jgi:hypothetical protein
MSAKDDIFRTEKGTSLHMSMLDHVRTTKYIRHPNQLLHYRPVRRWKPGWPSFHFIKETTRQLQSRGWNRSHIGLTLWSEKEERSMLKFLHKQQSVHVMSILTAIISDLTYSVIRFVTIEWLWHFVNSCHIRFEAFTVTEYNKVFLGY